MPTIGEIFRTSGQSYLETFGAKIPSGHQKAIKDLASCRTGDLGWHVYECPDCGEVHYVNHSCRNRSCPLCHSRQREDWLSARSRELLPVSYFHVIFTVPEELRRPVRSNPAPLLDVLMKAAGRTLLKFGQDARFIGGKTGVVMVLHTWTGAMEYHPHVHCVVSAGGIDGFLWRSSRDGFLFPVTAMSKVFRGIFLDLAREAAPELEIPAAVMEKNWVVYAKPAPDKVDSLIRYLGRYVHRVAISNSRILAFEEGKVSFLWKDSRDSRKKVMVLPVFEFMRRYLQHVLPTGFHKVRYFGFMSPSNRKVFRRVRLLLWLKAGFAFPTKMLAKPDFICKACGKGLLVKIGAHFTHSRAPPRS